MLQNLWNGVDLSTSFASVSVDGRLSWVACQVSTEQRRTGGAPAGHLPGTRKNRKQNEVLQNI